MLRTPVTSLWSTLTCAVLLGLTSAETINITANYGENANLTCKIASKVKVVEWSRPDMKPECILLYQNTQFDPDSQNPHFKNRVALQINDGDVTLTLKNVTTNDTGTYECRVLTKRNKRDVKPVSIIYLSVVSPGQTGGHTEDGGKEDGGKEDRSVAPKVALSVSAVLVAAVGFLSIERRFMFHTSIQLDSSLSEIFQSFGFSASQCRYSAFGEMIQLICALYYKSFSP